MNLYNRKIYIQYLLRFSYPMNLNKFWRSPFYKNMIKGKFIVVEGLDRSGKSTITRHIQRKLNAEAETLAMGFPDRTTKIGEMINEFLINKIQISPQTIHLLFSANRWQAMKEINQKLEAGINVVCDRYWYSGVAYSYAKGLDFEWCVSADKGLKEPDLTLFLKADATKLAQRDGYGNERYEKIDFQMKVNEAFQKILERYENPNIKVVDIEGLGLEEMKEQIFKTVQDHFNTQ